MPFEQSRENFRRILKEYTLESSNMMRAHKPSSTLEIFKFLCCGGFIHIAFLFMDMRVNKGRLAYFILRVTFKNVLKLSPENN